jgi:hypothetical protein
VFFYQNLLVFLVGYVYSVGWSECNASNDVSGWGIAGLCCVGLVGEVLHPEYITTRDTCERFVELSAATIAIENASTSGHTVTRLGAGRTGICNSIPVGRKSNSLFQIRCVASIAWMSVSCEYCVLSGRGLITRPEESYGMWCVWAWSDREASIMRWLWPTRACSAMAGGGCCVASVMFISPVNTRAVAELTPFLSVY